MPTLFNRKTIDKHRPGITSIPDHHLEVLRPWAESIASKAIYSQGEVALHGDFKARIIEDILGYTRFGAGEPWTCSAERQMGRGPVDLALGEFLSNADASTIHAAFELKGADTKDLDAIMPGRKITPVQQAWQYAVAVKGCLWVLVSNYVELRLYAVGQGTQNYEHFHLARLIEPNEYERFMLLLSAENLLSGATQALLVESHQADRDITDDLYADYKALRATLMAAVDDAAPKMDPESRIAVAQTILDRVLFTAFAEDTGLLPDNTLLNAFQHNDPYNPRPVWDNFKGLFRRIDNGDPPTFQPASGRILKYNGGLFQLDLRIDNLVLPDAVCEGFKKIGGYDFKSEVGVTILGHIFEQSIADMERLIAQARGEEPAEAKTTGTTGRRKRDGVVYTPDHIARFIVDQTLGAHLREMFAQCVEPRITKGSSVDDYENVKWRNKKSELEAWQEYQDRVGRLRIVDPACGSGVFLVIAFDFMKAEYKRIATKIAELVVARGGKAGGDLFEPDSEILSRNLFGVDVNAESVEITKLSLWIKTARRGKVLDSLDDNIRVGDSLIEDNNYAYREHGFTWRDAFPKVFAEGGFDVCLGNPPYVRMEALKAIKPYLQRRYEVASDRADLCAYFFERGLRILKPGGRLGYISSSTFFKTGSGRALRSYLRREAAIETVVDFGDLQIFEGVTTYPAILTMRCGEPSSDHLARFYNVKTIPEGDFSATFETDAGEFPQQELTDGSWEFEASELLRLRQKIREGKPTLKEVYGSPLYGIKSGLNAAFVIDTPTRDRLIKEDPNSAALLRPWLEGKDLRRWRPEPRGLWVIYIPKNQIDIDEYPAIKAHLEPLRERLEGRATVQEWFELQQSQQAYTPGMAAPKIMYRDIVAEPSYALDETGAFLDTTCFAIPTGDLDLLALLNSSTLWFFIRSLTTIASGGYFRMKAQYVEQLPIPTIDEASRSALQTLTGRAQTAAKQFQTEMQTFTRRIPDLCPEGRNPKLNIKLRDWWLLPDFPAFRKAVKAHYKIDIPPKLTNAWEDFFMEQKAKLDRLSVEITTAEAKINQLVYAIFKLKPDEIAVLEANIR